MSNSAPPPLRVTPVELQVIPQDKRREYEIVTTRFAQMAATLQSTAELQKFVSNLFKRAQVIEDARKNQLQEPDSTSANDLAEELMHIKWQILFYNEHLRDPRPSQSHQGEVNINPQLTPTIELDPVTEAFKTRPAGYVQALSIAEELYRNMPDDPRFSHDLQSDPRIGKSDDASTRYVYEKLVENAEFYSTRQREEISKLDFSWVPKYDNRTIPWIYSDTNEHDPDGFERYSEIKHWGINTQRNWTV